MEIYEALALVASGLARRLALKETMQKRAAVSAAAAERSAEATERCFTAADFYRDRSKRFAREYAKLARGCASRVMAERDEAAKIFAIGAAEAAARAAVHARYVSNGCETDTLTERAEAAAAEAAACERRIQSEL